ncbi:uncharacterized protein RCC_09037 [Ramularia collo-cygni]|uniref:Secreted protein n=1 Tax=Ramularia collo-cygni TaxID=112498 RepID=A0A2D3VC98_9PEZI|nr:uncharacterized protein RCC_09037 [Ramularia collo-cygni]CZT23325.1 uncharacterized protein RCC_09037 [Ramularia collo-cygni]
MTFLRHALVCAALSASLSAAVPSQPASYASATCEKAGSSENTWSARNLKTIETIYDLTVYPKNVPVITGGDASVPPNLFSSNATGRFSPVGEFVGFSEAWESFFAFAPAPRNGSGLAIYKADVVNFVSACPEVASSVVYLRTGIVSESGELDRSAPTSTLSQIVFWRFDDQGAVEKYQAWSPNVQAWTQASTGIDYSNMTIQQMAPQGLCPQIQSICTGSAQQFSSVEDCSTQLSSKPFGSFDEAWGDNLACRTVYLTLAASRPEKHCPSVGSTGGGKCVAIDYSIDYYDDAHLFNAPEGSVFTCPEPFA